jgi:hypothetical protein
MKKRTRDWENELWSYLNDGDGIICPLTESCQYHQKSSDCLSKDGAYSATVIRFLNNDSHILPTSHRTLPKMPAHIMTCRILELVEILAQNYSERIGIKELPVPIDIDEAFFDQPVSVRQMHLKSIHGAVWRLKDDWVIHLNSRDPSSERRFTLYHELFHIFAHCNATPVFKKAPSQKVGFFNELLADHFSSVMIMPEKMVRKKWLEVKDISKMAAAFDVPERRMHCSLKFFGLV